MRLIFSIPVVGDFSNGRATTRKSDKTWVDIASVAVPTVLGGAFSLTDFSTRLLSSLPGAALFLYAGLPLVLLVICLVVISSREKIENHSAGFRPEASPINHWIYRFSEAARLTAKIVLLPLSCLTAFYVWDVLP